MLLKIINKFIISNIHFTFGVKKMNFDNLEREDEQIAHLVQKEKERQENSIELIASENFVSKAVMEAMG